jgi:hypothetical protein
MEKVCSTKTNRLLNHGDITLCSKRAESPTDCLIILQLVLKVSQWLALRHDYEEEARNPTKITLTRGIEKKVQDNCARMKAYQFVCEVDGGIMVAGLVALAAAAEDTHPLEPARLLPHRRQPRLLCVLSISVYRLVCFGWMNKDSQFL